MPNIPLENEGRSRPVFHLPAEIDGPSLSQDRRCIKMLRLIESVQKEISTCIVATVYDSVTTKPMMPMSMIQWRTEILRSHSEEKVRKGSPARFITAAT
jgi:hypothetical protein